MRTMKAAGGTAVITRHSIRNYGSVLQAYATRRLIEETGRRATFIDYRQPGITDSARGYTAYTQSPGGLVGFARKSAYIAYRERDARARGALFEEFIQGRLNLTEKTYHSHEELAVSREFSVEDMYCVGSDQVWNLEYNGDSRPYYLGFAPTFARRFSFASSIGMDRLPESEEGALIRALSEFAGVSVRETSAANYLESLGIKASVHLDPTLGLSAHEWSSFAGPRPSPEPYILVYQLNPNHELEQASRLIGRHLGMRVVRIEYWKNFRGRGARKVVRPTVENFVGLFRDAKFVLSDSFHGTAFALNFDRPSAIFSPGRYASRIESILKMTNLGHRLVGSASQALDLVKNEPRQASALMALSGERSKMRNYLHAVQSNSVPA